MKFKERAGGAPRDSDPEERHDVHVTTNRCPFCHDGVERERSVACRDCLARHHSECWSEASACSACGSDVKLQVAADVLRAERRHPWVRGASLLAFLASVIVALSVMNASPENAILLVLFGMACASWGQQKPGATRQFLFTFRSSSDET